MDFIKRLIRHIPEKHFKIRHMSEEEFLDMDYFLNDDELDDDFGKESFYIF